MSGSFRRAFVRVGIIAFLLSLFPLPLMLLAFLQGMRIPQGVERHSEQIAMKLSAFQSMKDDIKIADLIALSGWPISPYICFVKPYASTEEDHIGISDIEINNYLGIEYIREDLTAVLLVGAKGSDEIQEKFLARSYVDVSFSHKKLNNKIVYGLWCGYSDSAVRVTKTSDGKYLLNLLGENLIVSIP